MEEHSDRIPEYKSYWLRCWKGGSRQAEGKGNWRFSLQDPVTGQKRGFTELHALVAYLETELVQENQESIANQDAGSPLANDLDSSDNRAPR